MPTSAALEAAVEAGLGATAISASVAAPSIEAGLLHCVALDLPQRDFAALRHRERHLGKTASALLRLIAAAMPAPASESGPAT